MKGTMCHIIKVGMNLLKIDIKKVTKDIIRDLNEEIPELIKHGYKFKITQLHSKKNIVVKLKFNKKPNNFPIEITIKIFRTKNIVSEINILQRLENQKIKAPKLLLFKNPYLILEKLNGINLSDFINDNLKDVKELNDLKPEILKQIIFSIEKLAEWFAILHEKNIVRKKSDVFVLNKGDTRLRDFIVDFSDRVLYGVDFEDTYEGNHLDDIAWICCSLLDTNPGIFELGDPKQKIELINIFLRKYYHETSSFNFNFNYLAEKIVKDLNIVIKRRGKGGGSLSITEILRKIGIKS